MLFALVQSAKSIKMVKATIVVNSDIESEEFFNALSDYNELFFKVHEDLSEILRPLILDDNFKVSAVGCAFLEKYFNMFKTPSTEAEKIASKYCLKYKI